MSRSRGGLTTKIHACIGMPSNLLRWILTGGQVVAIAKSPALVDDILTEAVVADKGYDSNALPDPRCTLHPSGYSCAQQPPEIAQVQQDLILGERPHQGMLEPPQTVYTLGNKLRQTRSPAQ